MAGSRLLARLSLTLLAVAPPAAVLLRSPGSATGRPVLSALLLAGYEALVLAVGFAGKVFGELEARWAARAADRLDVLVRGRLSRFDRRYRQFVQYAHRFTDLKGLATQGDHTPLLREVFVDVSLLPSPLHTVSDAALAGLPEAAPVRASLEALLASAEPVVLAITGAPGTGKTTLLEYTAVRLARQRRRSRQTPRTLPVLLFLRRHAAAVIADPEVTLADRIRSTLGAVGSAEPPGWFESRLDQGSCVIMLDGLDEVARPRDRHVLMEWVERQISLYPLNDWILTSRPHGYQSRPLGGAQTLKVRRFTGQQITRFLHRWYQAVERISTGLADEGVTQVASARAEDLLDRLRDRPMLYDLAANPLLLTMIANVHRYRRALPGSRGELYAEISQVLLYRRQEAKGVELTDDTAGMSGPQRETVLCALAFTMMAERIRDIPADRAEALLEPALGRVGGGERRPRAFLASVLASGLLVERDINVYSFAHQTFQEHLAAVHIREHHLEATLVAAVGDAWWREVTLLWAAFSDPSPVVERCLADGGAGALALAFDCVDEAVTVRPEVRRALEEFRQQALQSPPGSELRRLMTAVTVSRSLRPAVMLADDVFLCDAPVSAEVFRLFAEEFPAAAVHCAATAQQAGGPAAGMIATAATTFVRWVNGLAGGSTVYRLPQPAELDDPVARSILGPADHTVWCSGERLGPAVSQPRLWAADDGGSGAWTATGDRVQERMRQDAATVPSLLAAVCCTRVHADARAALRARRRAATLAAALAARERGALGHAASALRAGGDGAADGTRVAALVRGALALAESLTPGRGFERSAELLPPMRRALGTAAGSPQDGDLVFAHAVTHDFVNAVERDAAHVAGPRGDGHARTLERARSLAETLELVMAVNTAAGIDRRLGAAAGRQGGGLGPGPGPGDAREGHLAVALDTGHDFDLGEDTEEVFGHRPPGFEGSGAGGSAAGPDAAAVLGEVSWPADAVLDPLEGPALALGPGAVVLLAVELEARLGDRGAVQRHSRPDPAALLTDLMEGYGRRAGRQPPRTVPIEELAATLAALPGVVSDACDAPGGIGAAGAGTFGGIGQAGGIGQTGGTGESGEVGAAGWRPLARQLAQHVAVLGDALIRLSGGPHPVTAAALRFGAMALGSLGEALGHDNLAGCAGAVAAGVTVLQDRKDGVLVPREVLLLVRS